MEKILTDSAWKSLSVDFQWTEQWLDKCKDKVDWKEISDNRHILWIPSMLEKFKHLIDWTALSQTACLSILTEECLERYKDYWDWSELSGNTDLKTNLELIDKFIDRWDWSELIDKWDEHHLYNTEFLERYIDHIPASQLQDSKLWRKLVEVRTEELKAEIVA